MFWISFYHDRGTAPTGPNDLSNAMTCNDFNHRPYPPDNDTYPPFIYYNLELYKTAGPFYAQCNVPANTTNFYAQIDTCDITPGVDADCTAHGYVLELLEPGSYIDNIAGPVVPGASGGGGNSRFLPYIGKQ